MTPRRQQRGIAMMTAVMLVALATVLAVSIKFKDVMAARRAGAVFSVEQDLMLAAGAEAMAAYVIDQDDKKTDYEGEAWHRHYGPVELGDSESDGAPQGALEAQLEDEAGKFNLNSLVDNSGVIDPVAVKQFEFLLSKCKLQTDWAEKFADWIDADTTAMTEDGVYAAQTPAYLTANLPITSISELLQLPEFGRENFDKIAPYVTALPSGTPLNICTAKDEVLNAFVSGVMGTLYEQSWPRTGKACFPTKADAIAPINDATQKQDMTRRIAETTNYFRLETIVSIGTTQFALYSLIYRDGQGAVRPILRTYGTD